MKQVKEKRPPQTPKEKMFAKAYAKTGNATEAALKAYDTKNRESAAQIGYENLGKLDFSVYLERAGLTDEQIANNLQEATEATKVISATIVAGDSKEAGSQTNDFIEVPDWTNRIKANELVLKVKDKFPKQVANQTNVQVNIPVFKVMSSEAKEQLEKLYEGSDSTNN